MKCLNCSREIDKSLFPEDLTYCPYCGQEMGSASIGEKLRFCPYCGKKLTDQTSFCPHCGKKLVSVGAKGGKHDIHSLEDIQQAGMDFIDKTAKPIAKKIRNTFGRERKVRKLYQQWAEFSNLPPEEIPSIEELKNMSAEEKAREDSQPDDDED
ncbi:MAG: zinc ribbon domain-containing protein [Chloroflexota bacterium]